jgi:hypothetical protein
VLYNLYCIALQSTGLLDYDGLSEGVEMPYVCIYNRELKGKQTNKESRRKSVIGDMRNSKERRLYLLE